DVGSRDGEAIVAWAIGSPIHADVEGPRRAGIAAVVVGGDGHRGRGIELKTGALRGIINQSDIAAAGVRGRGVIRDCSTVAASVGDEVGSGNGNAIIAWAIRLWKDLHSKGTRRAGVAALVVGSDGDRSSRVFRETMGLRRIINQRDTGATRVQR